MSPFRTPARQPAPLRPLAALLTAPPRYLVSATRADGTTENWQRTGGQTIAHAQEAMEVAGLGGVVRVAQVQEAGQ